MAPSLLVSRNKTEKKTEPICICNYITSDCLNEYNEWVLVGKQIVHWKKCSHKIYSIIKFIMSFLLKWSKV